jgi:hypothetical protein
MPVTLAPVESLDYSGNIILGINEEIKVGNTSIVCKKECDRSKDSLHTTLEENYSLCPGLSLNVGSTYVKCEISDNSEILLHNKVSHKIPRLKNIEKEPTGDVTDFKPFTHGNYTTHFYE